MRKRGIEFRCTNIYKHQLWQYLLANDCVVSWKQKHQSELCTPSSTYLGHRPEIVRWSVAGGGFFGRSL
ncbi:hypothetical protein PAXRUDRAFT_600467 [Paxillus rubicundulus Ve08.2h10]|uniref:Uncharacterized protein n=1 Tax=Paxillus rubicundulus Ve08.2h10 TaxID=930991 RepID=A0A0D0DP37_9AGAM|nr:hypothetical protein PAXRUDRAFT_600467 [Paxillus rubicundulus Ve08.2h10]